MVFDIKKNNARHFCCFIGHHWIELHRSILFLFETPGFVAWYYFDEFGYVKQDTLGLFGGGFAFVDLDTISLKYNFINDQAKSLKARYDGLNSQYENMVMSFQEEYKRFQESVNAGIAPQAQLEQKQAELQKKNNEIIQKENQIKNLEMEMEKVKSETMVKVNEYIARYNNEYNYDFIFSRIGEELGGVFLITIVVAFGVMIFANIAYVLREHDFYQSLLFNMEAKVGKYQKENCCVSINFSIDCSTNSCSNFFC